MNTKALAFLLCFAALQTLAGSIVIENEDVKLTFIENTRLTSVREKATGRELLGGIAAWVQVTDASGKTIIPERLAKRGSDELVFTFADGKTLVERVTPQDWGLEFAITECTLAGVRRILPAYLRPGPTNYVGQMACAVSDDQSVLCLRAFEYETMMSVSARELLIMLDVERPLVGKRFGLVACPRAVILPKLRAMVKASGCVYSEAGGPWSLGSPQTRQSYFFGNILARNADRMIASARRAGASIFHLETWERSLGHYTVNTDKYPGGLNTLKEVADKIHAAGMYVSMHSLTACISFHDSWVTPVAHSNLLATYTYTLAEPLTSNSTEVVVNEMPGPKHDVVLTYTSNGNVLQLGGELITYTGIRRERPYAFTGITRGCVNKNYKTIVVDHAAGENVKYLQQRYFAFYPEPDSPLADELADQLAGVYNTIGAEMIYLDGSEGMKSDYGTATMGAKIVSRFNRKHGAPRVEMSCSHPHFWPFRSTIGAWDTVRYGAKLFEDVHLARNKEFGRKSNFLETQMGWWTVETSERAVRPRFMDEVEYFSAKNAGADTAASISSINGFAPVPLDMQERALTIIGWYERFRLARAFSSETLSALQTLGHEGELRQDARGAWTYTPVTISRHRVQGPMLGDQWTVEASADSPANVRVEMFYNLSPYKSAAAFKAFPVADMVASGIRTSSPAVKIAVSSVEDGERGTVAKVVARRMSGTTRGTWALVERTFAGPHYANMGDVGGVGVWVKGDGSGAILNIQLEHPREYDLTQADNLVKLDFKGWRYVELLFRERDPETSEKYVWPSRALTPKHMNRLRVDHISAVRVLVGEIPAQGVDIALSEIRALGLKEATAEEVTLTLNGEEIELPFEMASGDWAELRGGEWNLYTERGEFKERAKGPRISLKAGNNQVRYAADISGATLARAEVKVMAYGVPKPALKPLTCGMRKQLDWEAEMPANWVPSKGAKTLPPVRVRPGEKARLEITLRGPIANPMLKVGDSVWKLESVSKNALKTFKNGPYVEGVVPVTLESTAPQAADALVEFVKVYAETP